ncbi:MAG: hydrolase 2, exosortase A system-associated [Duganella sp.]
MICTAKATGAQPFFLPMQHGARFCIFHAAHPGVAERGAVLYVHPFAEELNKSRRMAAVQARALAAAGYAVLQPDLYGCGDSSGDFADARWPIWLDDLAESQRWLLQRSSGPFYLWGLRLGALLALDFAGSAAHSAKPDGLLLWQTVTSGGSHLQQFTRLQATARLFSETQAQPSDMDGEEIAGYRIATALAQAIRRADALSMVPSCPVQWLELAMATPGNACALAPATALVLKRWRAAGVSVDASALRDTPFWNSSEITEAPGLLAASLAALQALPAMARSAVA